MGFAGHPYWPPVALWFRNAAYVVFFVGAVWFLISGIRQARKCEMQSLLSQSPTRCRGQTPGLQLRHSQAAGNLFHLRLGKRFALLNRLLHAAQNSFFQKLDVVWIDNCMIDLD